MSLQLGKMLLLLAVATCAVRGENRVTITGADIGVSADGRQVTFSTRFRADSIPYVRWYDSGFSLNNVVEDETMFNGDTKEGATFYRTGNKSYHLVWMQIGALDSHYFVLGFQSQVQGNLTYNGEYAMSSVTPGTDVPYKAGSRAEFTVEVKNDRNTDVLDFLLMIGTNATGDLNVEYSNLGEKGIFTVKTENSSDGGSVVSTISMNTDQQPFNGYFRSNRLRPLQFRRDQAISSLGEEMVFRVHEKRYKGPLPDGQVYMRSKGKPGCVVDRVDRRECRFTCQAFANILGDLDVYKVSENGSRSVVPTQKYQEHAAFDMQALFTLDMSADFTGDYLCVATDDKSREVGQRTITVFQVQNPVNITKASSRELDNTTLEVTCEAESDIPVTTKIVSSNKVEFKPGVAGVLEMTEGGATNEGSYYSSSVVAKVQKDVFVVMYCTARNAEDDIFRRISPE